MTKPDVVRQVTQVESAPGELFPDGRRSVYFRMDMSASEFEGIREQFLSELAEALNVDEHELTIGTVHKGCIIVEVQMPSDVYAYFVVLREHNEFSIKLIEVLAKYRIDDMWPYGEYKQATEIMIRTEEVPIEAVLSGNTLSWLHISDLHLHADEGANSWKQNIVTDAFLEQLPILLSDAQVKPDFVFVTGDVSFSGKTHEYKAASALLAALQASIDGSPPIYPVPGNHDVLWDVIDIDIERLTREKLTSMDAATALLVGTEHAGARAACLARQQAFFEFAKGYWGESDSRVHGLMYTASTEVSGLEVGIVGLNSSWLSTRKDITKESVFSHDADLGHLFLTLPQLVAARNHVQSADLKIALIHHPPLSQWFNDVDQEPQSVLIPQFDFLLSGHEHRPAPHIVNDMNSDRESLRIPAGALYTSTRLPKGFNAVVLNIEMHLVVCHASNAG